MAAATGAKVLSSTSSPVVCGRLTDKRHGSDHQISASCKNAKTLMAGRQYNHGGVKLTQEFYGQLAALQSSSHIKAWRKSHESLQTVLCDSSQQVDEPVQLSSPPKIIPVENFTSAVALAPPSVEAKTARVDPHVVKDLEKQLSKTDSDSSGYGPGLHRRPASQRAPISLQRRKPSGILEKTVGTLLSTAKERLLSFIIDLIYQPILSEPSTYFKDNFGPVAEIGGRVPVQVIKGALPADFPEGIYLRDGPNPQHGGGYHMDSPFGKSVMHWFEGDGMLHATYFEKDGKISYQNRFVETEAYLMEKKRNKPVFLPYIKGDPKAITTSLLLNWLRFGKPTKGTCNTTVYHHNGRVYSVVEGTGLPYETDMSDNMRTVGSQDFKGAWDRGFTAHPKLDPDTNEMIVTGYSAFKPYLVVGVVASDGETLVHKVDVGLDRCTLSHDTAITPRYTIIFDYPLTADVRRLLRGDQLMAFDHDTYARIGVMPRFGDTNSMKWFNVEMNCTSHVVNAFEEGDEVVLHGFRSLISLFPSPPDMDQTEWFGRAVTPLLPGRPPVADPWVDGALLMRFHEWRFNMVTGGVTERSLSDNNNFMEFPAIHESKQGKKYKYAYANVVDLEATLEYGVPVYGKQIKLHVPDTSSIKVGDEIPQVRFETRELGPNRFGSEPQFVARPGGVDEDDGWLVTYVYDRSRDTSEVEIVSTKDFEGSAPVATISLPQRVPFGFHGCFVPDQH